MKKTEPLASPYHKNRSNLLQKSDPKVVPLYTQFRSREQDSKKKTNPRIKGEKKRDDEYVESLHL